MAYQYLENLGFTKNEIEIYLLLLRRGKMTAAEIAQLTHIRRPTVYSTIKELVKRGVAIEDLGHASRVIIPKPPSDLIILINREQTALDKKKQLVVSAIEELNKSVKNVSYGVPKFVFIPSEELRNYLKKQTPHWSASAMERDGCWWGFQDHTFVQSYKDYIDSTWKDAPPSLTLRFLTNESETEQRMKLQEYKHRYIKYWEPDGTFTASTWICGDYVIMAYTNSEPHYLIEIHDAAIAHNLRMIFKTIWKYLDAGPIMR